MTPVIQDVISGLILAAVSWATGWMARSVKHLRERDRQHELIQAAHDKAMEEGLRTLLRAELREFHHRYVDLHEPLAPSMAEEVERVYHAYHALGGNGTGTRMYEEIMALL